MPFRPIGTDRVSGRLRLTTGGTVAGLTCALLVFGAHVNGPVAAATPATPLWPNFDHARGVASQADGNGGYILGAFGGLHPFALAGAAPPAVRETAHWAGWDIARGLALRADGHSGYVLDGLGGLHPFGVAGDMPPAVTTSAYWPHQDIARGVALRADGQSGWVLDGWGGLHPFGLNGQLPATPSGTGYWPGTKIARGVATIPGSDSGYVLDGWGGTHPFTTGPPVAPLPPAGYSQGQDIARGLAVDSSGDAYMVSDTGVLTTMAPSGSSQSLQAPLHARGISFGTDVNAGGVMVDAFGSVTAVQRQGGPSPSPTGTPTPSPSGTPSPSPTGTPTPIPTPTPTPTPPPQTTAVNTGLMERAGGAPAPAYSASIHAYIVEAHWNNIQPNGPNDLVTTTIDREVAAVRAWNKANPSNPRGLRMRIFTGWVTPAWAMDLGGPRVHLCSGSGPCGDVPRWWTTPVQDAYRGYTQKLAAYVNAIPEIREVTVGLTMVRFGEVMVRDPKTGGNAQAYSAAGYTTALDIAAMKAEIDDGAQFSATTQVDVADYQSTSGQDISVSKQVMDYAVQTYPGRIQFANASINDQPTQNAAIFDLMKTYGPNGNHSATITFQSYPTPGNVSATVSRAVGYGACSFELPVSGYTATDLVGYDRSLQANCS